MAAAILRTVIAACVIGAVVWFVSAARVPGNAALYYGLVIGIPLASIAFVATSVTQIVANYAAAIVAGVVAHLTMETCTHPEMILAPVAAVITYNVVNFLAPPDVAQ